MIDTTLAAIPSTLALSAWATGAFFVLFFFFSICMILIVLVQKPQGGGLSGAFGAPADGAGQTAFGARTGDALTTVTVVVFVLFLLSAIFLNFMVRPTAVPPTQPQAQNAPADGETEAPAGGESGSTTEDPADGVFDPGSVPE